MWKIEDSLKEATRANHFEFTDSESQTTSKVAVQYKTEDWPADSSRSAGRQESTNHRPLSLFNPLAAAIQDN